MLNISGKLCVSLFFGVLKIVKLNLVESSNKWFVGNLCIFVFFSTNRVIVATWKILKTTHSHSWFQHVSTCPKIRVHLDDQANVLSATTLSWIIHSLSPKVASSPIFILFQRIVSAENMMNYPNVQSWWFFFHPKLHPLKKQPNVLKITHHLPLQQPSAKLHTATSSGEVYSMISVQRLEQWMVPRSKWNEVGAASNVTGGFCVIFLMGVRQL